MPTGGYQAISIPETLIDDAMLKTVEGLLLPHFLTYVGVLDRG